MPDPLGPSSATSSPGATSSVASSTARMDPNDFATFETWIAAELVAAELVVAVFVATVVVGAVYVAAVCARAEIFIALRYSWCGQASLTRTMMAPFSVG